MLRLVTAMLLLLCTSLATADISKDSNVQNFIQRMAHTHQFDAAKLTNIFQQVNLNPKVIQKIAKPYEAKPWYEYRTNFLQPHAVDKGVAFWCQHASTLKRAERKYGVPAYVIVGIIGVETKFGEFPGQYRVIDALSSLAFYYPPRSKFFMSELEQYLLLSREMHFDPLTWNGSYAGAIGIPQFMPSSYRRFAIKFSMTGPVDLQHNMDDVIGSIAHYLSQNGWRTGSPVVTPATITSAHFLDHHDRNISSKPPRYTLNSLKRLGIETVSPMSTWRKASLISLQDTDRQDHWLGFYNFYVITRYNTSEQYAMAVYLLGNQIQQRFEQQQVVHHV